ncbi:hypothetical protein MRX96_008373 [Rhipicephalus microplus]
MDFVKEYGRFNRIYSFFCFNWLKDQAKAMSNVSQLLTPSGECVLVFPAWSPTRELWRQIAQLDRWKKFSKVFEDFTPKSQDLEGRQGETVLPAVPCRYPALRESCCIHRYRLKRQSSLRKDVTNLVLKWTSDSAFSSRPCVYLVHARKQDECTTKAG